MKLYFTIQEFCKLDGIEADIPITPELAQKVFQFHMLPLNDIRATLGLPIYIRSGWRPKWWERAKGRDGDSQHCYKGKGATDLSIEPSSDSENKPPGDWVHLFKLLQESPYRRISWYPDLRFFHVDYKIKERKYYINKQGWHSIGASELVRLISKSEQEGQ